jgi:hypothetical protein
MLLFYTLIYIALMYYLINTLIHQYVNLLSHHYIDTLLIFNYFINVLILY